MTEIWSAITGWVHSTLGITPSAFSRMLGTLAVVVAYFVVRRVVEAIISRRIEDPARQYTASKTASYLLGLIGLVVVLKIWLGGGSGVAAYLGILSAGLAIALQDPLTNLAGWLFVTTRKPFVLGDRVQVGDQAGDVVDIRLFQFSIVEIGNWVDADQSTGRLIHIPNGLVFKQSIANYTQGFNFIWNEIPVTLTFESNWERAQQILLDVAQEHSAIKSEQAARQVRSAARKFLIFFQHLTPIVWTAVAAHGVTLTIRYLCEPRKRRSSESAIWQAILKAFAEAEDIDFAYPTQRFFDNAQEGKPALARTPPKAKKP